MYSGRKEKLNELLAQFAKQKEIYQSDLDKKTGVSKRNIIRQLEVLEENDFIVFEVERLHERGRGKYIWKITLKGLFVYLRSELERINLASTDVSDVISTLAKTKMENIAANHVDLIPLIFGKWDFFKKNNLDGLITFRLMLHAVVENALAPDLIRKPLKVEKWINETDIQELKAARQAIMGVTAADPSKLTATILLHQNTMAFTLEQINFAEQSKRFLGVLKKDPELREFVGCELKKQLALYEKCAEEFRNILESWQRLPNV